ncbi:thiol reductant ABC exporter subunit CydC [Wenzhouxiangella limi]|uniref:Thiol reductant ABC exporter subunit CydC n=1 Tax=Wenzhouxiangella limi TaxID=2707351 RepID=A0A845UVL8_9GAMM|nr:thiol reductant ABC exporter subunit CydC [Wenzhouxiangella limi]NDY94584.1 thiol reductant ABC exporter subunit CydC [Wenzhouxiangella limi]
MHESELKLGAILGRRRWWLLAGTLLMVLSLIAGTALLGLSGWFITASALAGLGVIASLDIFTPGAGIRLAAVVRTVSRYLERLITHEATFRLLTDLRGQVFGRLLQLDEYQLRGLRRGDTLNRLTTDVDTLDHLFIGVAGPTAAALMLTMAVAGLFGILLDAWTALAVLGLLLVNPALAELSRRRGHRASHQLVETLPELRREASESLESLSDLVAYDRVPAQRQRLLEVSARVIGLQEKLARLDALSQGLVTMTGFLAVWAVLVLSIGLFQQGLISGPVLGLAVLTTLGLGEAWQTLPGAWRKLEQCRGAHRRIAALTAAGPGLPVAEQPRTAAGNDLVVDNVSFRYRPELPRVLDGFNLRVAGGERIALIGPSGCGKTTLAQLIMRQLDPDEGRLLLGGEDLRRLEPASLRRHIGLLSQHPMLFHDTVARNLRLARPEASDEDLGRALAIAGLANFMDGLEHGLETWISEAGGNVSGGEGRRLALARLILTDCPVVILDEPTTGLDRETALGLAETLDQWLGSRTAIMITHDPDTLPRHDRRIRMG